ncbi:MAG: hypothetical protein IKO74_04420 [Selenomonadaceae bacterium]|nr:hypothetical protein [Selenomonadaceae bacterium]
MRGVDVSIFNENVDWAALKAAGIDFAIVRTGYGKTGFDENFQHNVEEAHKAGLICGAYHYSYALTPSDAAAEAAFCKGIIERAGVLLELPVWFAMSDDDEYKKRHFFEFTKAHVTNICKAFLDNIKPLNCGVFANLSWLEDFIDWQSLGCEIWSAQWNKEDNFKGRMWQYTNALTIGGQTFNGNILYDKSGQEVLGATTQPQAAPQTTNDLIHSILSAHAKDEAAAPAQPATPQTPKPQSGSASAQISSILSNIKPKTDATKSAEAQPSAADKIHSILSNARNKK